MSSSRICLSLPGPTCEHNIATAEGLHATYSALEIRIDLLEDSPEKIADHIFTMLALETIRRAIGLHSERRRSKQRRGDQRHPNEHHTDHPHEFSLILTLRRAEDGGRFTGTVSEGERILLQVLRRLIGRGSAEFANKPALSAPPQNTEHPLYSAQPQWESLRRILAIDVEVQSPMPALTALMQSQGIRRICSLHIFEPDDFPQDILGLLHSLRYENAGGATGTNEAGSAQEASEASAPNAPPDANTSAPPITPNIPKLAILTNSLAQVNAVIQAGQHFARLSPPDHLARPHPQNPDRASQPARLSNSAHFSQSEHPPSPAHSHHPFILIAMGEHGLATRALPEKIGSAISYASAHAALAAGQVSTETLHQWRHCPVNDRTSIFGIVGNPVSHSHSPAYHNARFAQAGANALYIPLYCATTADVHALPEFARLVGLRGASVTVPHKEAVRHILHSISPEAQGIGAVNTIYLGDRGDVHDVSEPLAQSASTPAGKATEPAATNAAGNAEQATPASEASTTGQSSETTAPTEAQRWHGTNTDCAGFTFPIQQFLSEQAEQGRELRATVIGAGGAARSAVYALLSQGWNVLLLNRNLRRAEDLAQFMRTQAGSPALARSPSSVADSSPARAHTARPSAPTIRTAPLSDASLPLIHQHNALIVQCTSLGMDASTADPLPFYQFTGSEFLYDIVYTPPITPIMQRAMKAGCRVINGLEMFQRQAELQSQLFLRAIRNQ